MWVLQSPEEHRSYVWFQLVGVLISITLEIVRINLESQTLWNYPQIGIYQKPEPAYTWVIK